MRIRRVALIVAVITFLVYFGYQNPEMAGGTLAGLKDAGLNGLDRLEIFFKALING